MKHDTCLNSSSVDAILVVFTDLLQRKQTNETHPLCGRLKYFRGSTTRLGE